MDEEALARELMETYRAEARERLDAVTGLLLELERAPTDAQAEVRLEQVYREIHSLKGAARSVSQTAMEEAAHAFEDILATAKSRPPVEALPVQAWYPHLDRLSALLESGPEPPQPSLEPGPPLKVVEPPAVAADQSIRVATPRLDRLMADLGTMLVSEQAQADAVRQLSELSGELAGASQGMQRDEIRRLRERLDPVVQTLRHQRTEVRRQLQSLDDGIRALRMTSVRALFRSFDRMVHDLAKAAGKEIRLEVTGESTELDKGVLDALRDPLTHLVRNAIDHGIERGDRRLAQGKSAEGHLRLAAQREGSTVLITLEDDGRGIDRNAVRARAASLAGDRPLEINTLSDAQLHDLIFRSGFSTREEVSDLSGRGLGLAIVRQALDRLHGTVAVERSTGAGTTFKLTVPLTLATTRCLLLKAGANTYALPLEGIHRTIAITTSAILPLGGQPSVSFEGRAARVFHLAALLDGRPVATQNRLPVLVIDAPAGRVALAGDALRGEQELVVKPFPPGVPPVPYLAGAATLASGEVILVVDPRDLVERALRSGARSAGMTAGATGTTAVRKSRVLVADDSVTTRTLERNILKAAGYEVSVASDGAEAWSLLQAEPFDLLISDVEMPNVDGLVLTERVRADARLKSMLVVLVTARGSAQDRVRGLQAGADAYIAKQEFRQSDLLETVDRLLGRSLRAVLKETA
jgi:two-component system chemotaxis sensor kinase CheA